MRKLIALSALLFCVFMFLGIAAYAESDSGEKIEISFKVGDETLKINDKDITVEKPFVVNGVTLVPLRVITEAFGAEVNWDSTNKTITLKYGDVLIKLVVGSKDALVDEKKSSLLQAPVIKNGVTMVPIRFITENFGAEVSFDNETQTVSVLKEFANSNSIKDFGLILKKTNKSKVGDSYYGWSISLPKKLKMSYRNFNGTVNDFTADDESYSLNVAIDKLEDETLDSLLSKEIGYAEDYTILDQGIRSINGQSYVKCAAKGEEITYEDRIFINNGRIYYISVYLSDYGKYKNNKDLAALLDSFSLKFSDDGDTEDLSDINAEGLRKYEDKNLKWSLLLQPDMEEIKDSDKENDVRFVDENSNLIILKMYSIEDGLTLDKWIEDELKNYKEMFNPELVKVLSVEDGTLNGTGCKKLLASIKYSNEVQYFYDIYMLGKNYRYDLSYMIASDEYNNPEIKEKFDNIINSFKFSEPDADEVGQLIDPDRIILSDGVRKIENKDYKWYFEIPVSWTAGENNTDSSVEYYSKNKDLGFSMLASKNVSFDGFISTFEEKLEEGIKVSGNSRIDLKEDINDKGTLVKKYIVTSSGNDNSVKEVYYVLSKNGILYMVYFNADEISWSEKNVQTIDNIWKSMRFE